ncbi:MAG: PAS domain S-box protein, partial [Pseudomonadota bacterium]
AGKSLGRRASNREITERKQAESLILAQRDLSIALSGTSDLNQALSMCIDTAISVSGFQAAGVYMVDGDSGLTLRSHKGWTSDEVAAISRLDPDSGLTRLIMNGRPVYSADSATPVGPGIPADATGTAGVIALLPVLHQGEAIACFRLSSRVAKDISVRSRQALETIAAQVGSAITRIKAQERLNAGRERFRALYKAAGQREELYRSLLNSSPDAIALYDIKGNVKYLNPSYNRIFGWRPDEIEARTVSDIPDSEKDSFQALMNGINSDGTPVSGHDTIRLTKDGRLVHVSLSASRYNDHEGKPAGIMVILRDITDGKLAEAALRQMSKVFMESIDPIFIRDLDGTIVDLNEAAERIFGWTRDELIGKSIKTIVPPERHDRVDELQERCKRGESVRNVEALRWTRSGEIVPVLVSLSLLTDDTGKPVGIATITQNLTELKRTEKMLRERSADLERSNRDLEQFAYIAAHDLREPLIAVSAYLKLLNRCYKGKLDTDGEKYIEQALGAAQRMDTLIRSLLSYARLGSESSGFTTIDCEAVVHEALSNLDQVLSAGNASVTRDPMPTIVGDHSLMVQLFQNLVSNAVKFAGTGPPKIHMGVAHFSGEYHFYVKDNGAGIAEEHFDQIFRLFQRVSVTSDRPGTGIGLAGCKRIVERHGGRIWVESTPGQGSTFFFTIPDRAGSGEHAYADTP